MKSVQTFKSFLSLFVKEGTISSVQIDVVVVT